MTPDIINDALSKLKNKNSQVSWICHFFDLSFKTGYIPTILKTGYIPTILKTGYIPTILKIAYIPTILKTAKIVPVNSRLENLVKELSLCNKIKYLNLNIFRTRCCKPLIFQTLII